MSADRLDKFAETVLIPEYTRGAIRVANPEYARLTGAISDAWRRGDRRAARRLRAQRRKHRSTVTAMARKHRATITTPHGPRVCFQATVERPGRKPLVTRFGGIPLKRQKKAVITDRLPAPPTRRKELTQRLRTRRCEWCDTLTDVETHQVRKLADLTRTGRPQPGWAQLMARMRRKTLVVCTPCHQAIHHGHPTALTA